MIIDLAGCFGETHSDYALWKQSRSSWSTYIARLAIILSFQFILTLFFKPLFRSENIKLFLRSRKATSTFLKFAKDFTGVSYRPFPVPYKPILSVL